MDGTKRRGVEAVPRPAGHEPDKWRLNIGAYLSVRAKHLPR
jgi:hypothetical protein